MPSIVIVGGGFAGVWAALAAAELRRMRRARSRDISIHVVSRDSWLTIRPRLYESSLDDVRVPLDEVLAPAGVEYIRGNVTRIDTVGRVVVVADGGGTRPVSYDRLVVAAGSHVSRPPIPGIENTFGVDTYAEATALERHLASLGVPDGNTNTASTADARFSAVVVGAGFTGIEVATALASRVRSLAFTTGAAKQLRVAIVERAPVVAPDLGHAARIHVEQAFGTLGIDVRLGVGVKAVSPEGVTLENGDFIAAATTVWTGGLRASDLASQLGVARDEIGRVSVDEYLRIPGVAGVYAAGDVARAIAARDDEEHIASMSCQCAIPMGEVAGRNAAADLLGLPPERFAHTQYVTCLDLGDAGALFMEGWSREPRLSGFWGKIMKQTINTRLIYPPRSGTISRLSPAA